MRLINKYETSMRGGRAHYRSAVGAGELAGTGAGTRNQSRSWGVPTWLYGRWHRACRKDYARNQYSSGPQRKGSATFPKRERTRATVNAECLERSAPLEAGLSLNLNKLHTFDFGLRANAFLGVTFALLWHTSDSFFKGRTSRTSSVKVSVRVYQCVCVSGHGLFWRPRIAISVRRMFFPVPFSHSAAIARPRAKD